MPRNLPSRSAKVLFATIVASSISGCGCMEYKHRKPHITAFPASPANQCEAPGIPFYLPKPLLVVSKNFYHVEDAKIGLTGSAAIPTSFDSQADYAKLDLTGNFARSGSSSMKSNDAAASENTEGQQVAGVAHSPTLHSSSIPSGPNSTDLVNDGLGPHMFFTYEIVFVPDLTQKYSLEINGGAGEVRAAMNLVNGWQFTGLGPYYMKDSSTAQNIMANGAALNLGLGGASDVINSVANLKSLAGAGDAVGASDVAMLAEAMDRANQQETFDLQQIPIEAWGTKQVYHEDGSTEIIRTPPRIENYAEISVYEASLEGDRMVWNPIADHKYDREFLGIMQKKITPMTVVQQVAAPGPSAGEPVIPAKSESEKSGTSESTQELPNPFGAVVPKTNLYQVSESTLRGLLNKKSQPIVVAANGSTVSAFGDNLDNGLEAVEGGQGVVVLQPPLHAYSDPELTKEVLRQTLNPPARENRSLWERLHPRKIESTSTVNGTILE